jgi:hypothetical protein
MTWWPNELIQRSFLLLEKLSLKKQELLQFSLNPTTFEAKVI